MGCSASHLSGEDPLHPKKAAAPRTLRAEALAQSGKFDEALIELDAVIADWPECARGEGSVHKGTVL